MFGSFGALGYVPTPTETSLSTTIQGYWGRFANAKDPNGAGAPVWAKYDVARDNAATLDSTVGSKDGISTTACNYWDVLAGP